MVKIKLHLSFVERTGKEEFEVVPGLAKDLLGFLAIYGIRSDEVGMVVADGRWRNPVDVIIDEYSVIEVFPPLEGG